MRFKCLATGSTGNCYVLENQAGQALLLDCGIRWKDIKRLLAYRIDNIVGCLVTHRHNDHSLSADEIIKSGIEVWKPYEAPGAVKTFGDFIAVPFKVPHDGIDCYGFYIKCDGQRLIYATDFEYLPFRFQKQRLNHMIIECNYTQDMLELSDAKTSHVLAGHACLDTVKRIVQVNTTDNLMNVILIHASALLDTEYTETEIAEAAGSGVNVQTAVPGYEIELKDTPF